MRSKIDFEVFPTRRRIALSVATFKCCSSYSSYCLELGASTPPAAERKDTCRVEESTWKTKYHNAEVQYPTEQARYPIRPPAGPITSAWLVRRTSCGPRRRNNLRSSPSRSRHSQANDALQQARGLENRRATTTRQPIGRPRPTADRPPSPQPRRVAPPALGRSTGLGDSERSRARLQTNLQPRRLAP